MKNYHFILLTLHLWIKTFEYLLHITYRLNIKKWQVRNNKEKDQFHVSLKFL